ncbi:bifunctional uridylyltransferase/uridylyl-removing enzyme [Peptococcaceae bacterium CEB3]|nr:bifunctional uridylyltransferase/uridylyl-removing enzyme [Peptococcaceae bacterium CEB3]
MRRLNELIQSPAYQASLAKTAAREKERVYCKHGFDHLLAVARIAYAYLLERKETDYSREIVYAAALLHDLGRWVEYQTGEDHASAGARLAEPLLKASGFDARESALILTAIKEHRRKGEKDLSPLGEALALADDWSRECRDCGAQNACHKFSPTMLGLWY